MTGRVLNCLLHKAGTHDRLNMSLLPLRSIELACGKLRQKLLDSKNSQELDRLMLNEFDIKHAKRDSLIRTDNNSNY